MGEHPVFSTKAHVFQIDPETKKKWIPSASQPVAVSYYFDANRKTHRIIAIESTKVLINSTVTANMTFTKTSPKFGQWSDHRANTVYGLGFATPEQLLEFSDKFIEAKALARKKIEDAKKISTKQQVVQRSSPSPAPNGNGNVSPSSTSPGHTVTSPVLSVTSPSSQPKSESPPTSVRSPVNVVLDGTGSNSPSVVKNGIKNTSSNGSITKVENTDFEGRLAQDEAKELRFEIEQLKLALATSKANAKKLEEERDELKGSMANSQDAAELKVAKEKNATLEDRLAVLTSEATLLKQKTSQLEQENSRLQQDAREQKRREQATQQELKDQLDEHQKLQEQVEGLSEQLRMAEREKQSLQHNYLKLGSLIEQLQALHSNLLSDN